MAEDRTWKSRMQKEHDNTVYSYCFRAETLLALGSSEVPVSVAAFLSGGAMDGECPERARALTAQHDLPGDVPEGEHSFEALHDLLRNSRFLRVYEAHSDDLDYVDTWMYRQWIQVHRALHHPDTPPGGAQLAVCCHVSRLLTIGPDRNLVPGDRQAVLASIDASGFKPENCPVCFPPPAK